MVVSESLNTVLECPVSNTCYTIRDSNRCQTAAVIECLLSDTGYAVWDCNRYQTPAAIECPASNTGHAVWDSNRCQTAAVPECKVSNAGYAIDFSIIRNSFWNGNAARIFNWPVIIYSNRIRCCWRCYLITYAIDFKDLSNALCRSHTCRHDHEHSQQNW